MRPTSVKRALGIALVLLVACGRARSEAPRPRADGAPKLYEVDATVLESRDHGPMLCVGGIATSLPPQCGDVPITNWDWSAVEKEERMSGTIWGEFHLVGEYDGERFTVRETGPPTGEEPAFPGEGISTPCAEPPGGWAAHAPDRTTEADRLAANRYANRQPDHAGTWVQTVEGEGVSVVNEDMILTVAFTGDLDRHEAELRDLWGGPLCVVEHTHSARELSSIQRELSEDPPAGVQVTWSSTDVVENHVEVGVVAADDGIQAALDERYGEGVVVLYPALRPVS